MAASAAGLAAECDAAGIVVVEPLLETLPGRESLGALTRAVSQGADSRPDVPIISYSTSLKVCRQLSISRGVVPAHVPAPPEDAATAAAQAVASGLLPAGAPLVVLCDGALSVVTA